VEQLDANLYFGPSIYADRSAIVVTIRAEGMAKLPAREAGRRARDIARDGPVSAALKAALKGRGAVRWPDLMARLALALQRPRFLAPLATAVEDVPAVRAKRIVVETHEPEVMPFAAAAAFELTYFVMVGKARDGDAAKRIEFCLGMIEKNRHDWNTVVLLEACLRRGIPFAKTLANTPYMTLGQGIKRQRIRSSVADAASVIATQLADDKHLTKQLLRNFGMPVPDHRLCNSEAEVEAAVAEIGFPLVVKGRHAEQGLSVTTDIRTLDQARAAVRKAKAMSRSWLIESHVAGDDYRFTVVAGRVVAVAGAWPPGWSATAGARSGS